MNAFENAMAQLNKAADTLLPTVKAKKDQEVFRHLFSILHTPQRIVSVSIPVTMDSGATKLFDGYRVQFNNILGPYKGGIRYHPNVDLNEVKALAFWMTMKCAVAGLHLGGGKGGVVVDPKQLSEKELERLSRGFSRAIADVVGPIIDVPAPDVNTNGRIMKWMVDEYIKIKSVEFARSNSGVLQSLPLVHKNRGRAPSVKNSNLNVFSRHTLSYLRSTFTGKRIEDGGSEGREEATGLGGVFALQAMLKKLKISNSASKPLTVAVQGFGNVGYNAAKFLTEKGFLVVAVSDSKGGIYVPEGINLEMTLACKKKNGYLAGCYCSGSVCDISKGKQITNEELLTLPVDILVPSALENVITKENAGDIKAPIILEMANGPTTPEADTILFKKGITVIPDVVSNSGGVTVSAYEWMQNRKYQHWTKKIVNIKLRKNMESTIDVISTAAKKYKTDLRTASFIVALTRIANV